MNRKIEMNDQLREIIAHQQYINTLFDGRPADGDECIFKGVERGLLLDTPVNREIGRICKRTGILNLRCMRSVQPLQRA